VARKNYIWRVKNNIERGFTVQDALVTKAADNVRILSAAMVQKAKSGHPGGAMGAADATTLLFAEFLRFDPDDPEWMGRDRFFMDPGHMSPLLYSELVLTGRLTLDDVKNFRQLGSRTPGHPELDVMLGIENSSGPLGIGHGIALGAAIAERFMVERFGSILEHKTVCLVSDGGLEEEIAYGVGRIAGHLKLSNLIFFYDANQVQLSCKTEDVMSHDFVGQYKAWGFRVIECDGSNIAELRKAFKELGPRRKSQRSCSATPRWPRAPLPKMARATKAKFLRTASRSTLPVLLLPRRSRTSAVTRTTRSRCSTT
jgi:Transketolase